MVPHRVNDPVVAAAALVGALQVSRSCHVIHQRAPPSQLSVPCVVLPYCEPNFVGTLLLKFVLLLNCWRYVHLPSMDFQCFRQFSC